MYEVFVLVTLNLVFEFFLAILAVIHLVRVVII